MHEREVRPITPAVMKMLMVHEWPGNVRELRNAAERYALGMPDPLLAAAETPDSARLTLADQVDAFERKIIERSLAEAGGKISVVMDHLGIPRRTLSEKMARFGIDRRQFREPGRQGNADDPVRVADNRQICCAAQAKSQAIEFHKVIFRSLARFHTAKYAAGIEDCARHQEQRVASIRRL